MDWVRKKDDMSRRILPWKVEAYVVGKDTSIIK
jgi:hypothetical protein